MFNNKSKPKNSSDSSFDPAQGMTAFNEHVTVQKRSQQVWKSSQPLSRLRDRWQGDVSQVHGEYRVRTSEEEPLAYLTTLFRGDYVPGFEFEWGIGVRVPTFPSVDGLMQIGYFEYGTGFYVAIHESGVQLVWKSKGEIQEVVDQKDWNQDTLDGSGDENNPSGAKVDFQHGTIIQGRLVYYGYGFLSVYFGVRDETNHFRVVEAHVFGKREGVSLDTSNLFLSVKLNQGAGHEIEAYVGGRQMSLIGEENRQFRIAGEHRTRSDITDEWAPMISVQSKQELLDVFTQLFSVEVISEDNLLVGIFLEPSLDQTSFRESSVGHTHETAMLYDTEARTMDISDSFVFSGITLVPGKSAGSARLMKEQLAPKRLPEDSVVTVGVRRIDASEETKASLVMNVQEEW